VVGWFPSPLALFRGVDVIITLTSFRWQGPSRLDIQTGPCLRNFHSRINQLLVKGKKILTLLCVTVLRGVKIDYRVHVVASTQGTR
jgi:hypothetical protein